MPLWSCLVGVVWQGPPLADLCVLHTTVLPTYWVVCFDATTGVYQAPPPFMDRFLVHDSHCPVLDRKQPCEECQNIRRKVGHKLNPCFFGGGPGHGKLAKPSHKMALEKTL